MSNEMKEDLFRAIPKVDVLLKEERIQELCREYGHGTVVGAIRECLEELRSYVTDSPELFFEKKEELYIKIRKKVKKNSSLSIGKVYNATGIILHTNLGRAPLGENQLKAVLETFGGYANLEYNLETGKRGKRWEHYSEKISEITGAEAAIAVNNNAAAVTLILSALTRGKEVVVSRGELIEIGGRFRIPEVMEQSGAILRETGCTNRTRISDYEKMINENTGALLKVHTSNYKIVGFTEEVTVEELTELGRRYDLPVIVDLGSGILIDLEKYGLPHEPTVQEILRKGADLVCFSGDKLLGGPQAGIIAGKECYIRRMEEHPLMRAFRLDKCTIAALEATFQEYREEERAVKNIPVLKMITDSLDIVRKKAEYVYQELKGTKSEVNFEIQETRAMLGGGSMPGEEISSFGIEILPGKEDVQSLCERMRKLSVPIIGYIKNNKVILDLRTISERELEEFTEELKMLWE